MTMALDIKTISCPGCGSTDIAMVSETQGICNMCGAQFAVQQKIETQNIYNEIYVDAENADFQNKDICNKSVIIPEYSKDEFIRKSWIKLAKEDAPIEIFNEDFGEVSENKHQVLIDTISVDVTYQVSVGYDRQEPYTAYEDYYEKEPYIAYEKHFNTVTKQNEERQVTKYKEVKKQRQVTKYKTVTDWSPLTGKHSTESIAVVENLKDEYLDKELFVESSSGIKEGSVLPATADIASRMQVTETARESAMTKHYDIIENSVVYSLPGDHYRDLDWNVSKVKDSSSSLYETPEYEVSICYNEKIYKKHAFPFGSMDIGGDKIENLISLDTVIGKMEDDLTKQNEERKKVIDTNISKSTSRFSLFTIVLLVISIGVSLLIRSTALVLIIFSISVAAFIFNSIKVKRETSAETKRAKDEINSRTERVKLEIDNYSEYYKIKQRDALNKKLKSLGYEPATAAEL